MRWHTSVPLGADDGGSAAVVTRGRVFLFQAGSLRSFDLGTGRPGWSRPFTGDGAQLVPVDGLVLLGTSDDTRPRPRARVVAVDAVTGAHRWSYDPGVDAIQLYRVRPGLVVAQQRYTTVALDTATGRVRWRAPVADGDQQGAAFAQLAVSARTVVQGGEPTSVGLDAGTGRRLWAIRPGIGESFPFLTGSVALLAPMGSGGSEPGGVLAVDARTGRHRWTVRSADESGSVVAAGHGVVVAMTGGTVQGGRTTAVAAETGRVLWSSDLPAAGADDEPTAMTVDRVAYVEDHWDHDAHARRHIALVCRRLRDGRVLYRQPTVEPLTQGPPVRFAGPVLPLVIDPDGRGPGRLRSFSLDRRRVDFTVRLPHFIAASPVVLGDGSLVVPTADLVEFVSS